jgi:hypothetical protein
MDPVAERDQVRAAWWQEQQDKSGTVSWLDFKTKVDPVQRSGSQPKSTRGVWLVYSTKPTPSRDDVAAKS